MTATRAGDPASARTPAEFVELLREVRATSRLSFWEIQERARGLGYDLEPAALVHALGQTTLPDWQIVVGLLASCGYQGMEVDRWMRIYHDLAKAEQPRRTEDDDDYDDDGPVASSSLRPLRSRETSGRTPSRGLVAAAAAAVIVFALLIVTRWSANPAEMAAPPATSLPAVEHASTTIPKASPKPSVSPTPPPQQQATTQAPATQPPGVLHSGTVTLATGQGVDLDTGLSSGSLDIVAASGTALDARGNGNGKRLQLMAGMPSQQTCQSLNVGMLDREVTGLAPGQWLCVRTSAGRWARVNVTATGDSLKLSYLVWS